MSIPGVEVTSDQPQEPEDFSMAHVDQGAEVATLQVEEEYPNLYFTFSSTGNVSVLLGGTGTTALSTLVTHDEDEDQREDEDISEFLETLESIAACHDPRGHQVPSATILLKLFLPLRQFPIYECPKSQSLLDRLTSIAFLKQQVVLASKALTTQVSEFPAHTGFGISIRQGNGSAT